MRPYRSTITFGLVVFLAAACSPDTEKPRTAQEDAADTGTSDDTEVLDTSDAPPARDVDTGDSDVTVERDASDTSDTEEDDFQTDAPSGIVDPPSRPSPSDASLSRDALPQTFGPAAVINSLEVDTECCRDFDDDDNVDNAMGQLIETFADLADFDLNGRIETQLEEGRLLYLFEFGGWSDLAQEDSIEMYSHPARDATPDDTSDNFSGTGPFLIDPASYKPSGAPRADYDARVENTNQLRASAERVPFTVPFISVYDIDFTIQDAKIRARTAEPASLEEGGHVTLEEGRLSGAVTQEALFDNINRATRTICPCLGGKDLFRQARPDEFVCNDPPDACAGASGVSRICDPNVCETLIMPKLRDEADLNIRPSPRNDAYSIGLRFTAVGAHIEGVADPN